MPAAEIRYGLEKNIHHYYYLEIMDRIYLDWAATAVPDETILTEALKRSITYYGNPSSPHKTGKEAESAIEESRKTLADVLGCSPYQLSFTSGGTESNNIVLSSLLNKKRKGNIVISAIEHSSVYEPAMRLKLSGWELRIVRPEKNGIISAERFRAAVDENTALAALIMLNNETGSIQNIAETGSKLAAMKNKPHFHIDAVQAAGKIPLNLNSLPVDSASMSSHKFRGPRGTGLLYLKKPVEPVYAGGGQENGIRHGTENTFGITATAEAAKKAFINIDNNLSHALELKKILINRLSKISGAEFIPNNTGELLDTDIYSPYILSLAVKPVPGEVLVRVLSDRGFDIATGSACASGKKKRSRIMEAMSISSETAFSAIRISTGTSTTIEEINQFCDTFERESGILIKHLSH